MIAEIDNARESFGGDIRTQLIGTTICALALECEATTAARLFCHFLMPYLFGGSSPITDALNGQLVENTNFQKILNKGASRGWTNLFIETIPRMGLPEANQGWRYTKLGQDDPENAFLGEVNMVGGLLRWIAQDESREYCTISGCVGRIAACLKAVGYNISSIQPWTGHGDPPRPVGTKSLTLVLGGSSETDVLIEDFQQLSNTPLILHYQYKTTGSMLLAALQDAPDISPELLQQDFEQVFEYIEDHLMVNFGAHASGLGVSATCDWQKADDSGSRSTATWLASIFSRILRSLLLHAMIESPTGGISTVSEQQEIV